MDYTHVLKHQPWLRVVNRYNVTDRLQTLTKGNLFVVYNTLNGCYELHSVTGYKMTGSSIQVGLDEWMVNGFIVNDFKANNLRANLIDVQHDREKLNLLYDRFEDKRFNVKERAKIIERVMGTKV